MLVYLTATDKELQNYNTYHQITTFSRAVSDNEAREIICENFRSSFDYNDVPKVLSMLLGKLRVGASLTIIDHDIRLISRQVYREEVDINTLNSVVFSDKQIVKSFLTLEAIEDLIPPTDFKIMSKDFGSKTFTLTMKRK